MTDGKPIEWQKARAGYYNAESFAPGVPDGYLFWGYCLAYRLTRSSEHWQMVRELSRRLGLGDPGEADASGQRLDSGSRETDWRLIYALLELHQATGRADLLRMACLVGDNAVAQQVRSGLFPRPGRDYARTGDEIPLALLHLAAAITGERDALPRAISDRRYFHCKHDGPLEPHQIKRDDPRTYDHLVYYGEP